MKVVIVGAGTAGWILAARLATNPYKIDDLSLTLVEAPDVSTVGVGEGTWPSMRQTLKQIGVDEAEFIRRCNVSFKQGTQFNNWSSALGSKYCHPFDSPSVDGVKNVGEHWLNTRRENGDSFEASLSLQALLSEDGRAPKTIGSPNFQGHLNYGYHLDASEFATFLKDICTKDKGVQHLLGLVNNVELDDEGHITHIDLSDGRKIEGDLFFDCTGFRSLLLHQKMGIGYEDLSRHLFVDRALATRVPYRDDHQPIHSMTRSTAHEAGWIWDIGLSNRRGIGLVYSSSHMDEATAAETMKEYVGPQFDEVALNKISFQSRHLEDLLEQKCDCGWTVLRVFRAFGGIGNRLCGTRCELVR